MIRGVFALPLFAATLFADEPVKKAFVEPPAVRSLSFSPDGKLLAVSMMPKGRGGQLHVWDVAARKLVSKYEQAGELPNVVFAADGKSVVIANGLKLLTRVAAAKGTNLDTLGPFESEVTSLVRIGEARWLTLGKDGAFRIWDEKDKAVTLKVGGGKRPWAWSVSASGKWLHVSGDNVDRLWDLTAGTEVEGFFKQRQGSVNVSAFVGDDRLILGSNHGAHKVVEIPSGKTLMRFKNEGGTGAIVYSPKVELLAARYYTSASAALTPLSFRAPTDDEKQKLDALLKECDSDDYATREKASAKIVELGSVVEPLLAKASIDAPSAEVRLRARVALEMILNTPKFKLIAHAEEIRPMVFDPSGEVFATGGADGLVVLWDVKTGKELARLNCVP